MTDETLDNIAYQSMLRPLLWLFPGDPDVVQYFMDLYVAEPRGERRYHSPAKVLEPAYAR